MMRAPVVVSVTILSFAVRAHGAIAECLREARLSKASHATAEERGRRHCWQNDLNGYMSASRVPGSEEYEKGYTDTLSILASNYPFVSTSWTADDEESVLRREECRLYLAESSIEGAGLGIFTGVDLHRMDYVANPELSVVLHDKGAHGDRAKKGFHDRWKSSSMVSQIPHSSILLKYTWMSWVLETAQMKARNVDIYISGIGAATNSHLGLYNVALVEDPAYRFRYSSNRHASSLVGPERGAFTEHSNILVMASQREVVTAGSEIFVHYGNAWFTGREADLGPVPLEENFKEADRILRNFARKNKQTLGNAKDKETLASLQHKWDEVVSETLSQSARTAAALPKKVEDVSRVAEIGTAQFSVRETTVEWLEENGYCMDNIRGGPSSIPLAGMGAYAIRPLQRDDVIVVAPVIPQHRDQLLVYNYHQDPNTKRWVADKSPDAKPISSQLLLNYCFGNDRSSMLLCPYASGINFINHGGSSKANAEVRWSTSKANQLLLLRKSIPEILNMGQTGLVLDIVATRDIDIGEEVLIDYGEAWEDAWEEHLDDWEDISEEEEEERQERYELMADRTAPIRTMEEQHVKPYRGLRTACYLDYQTDSQGNEAADFENEPPIWQGGGFNGRNVFIHRNLRPCDVLQRYGNTTTTYYTVRLHAYPSLPADLKIPAEEDDERRHVPRWAIRLVEDLYVADQFALKQAFRHEIGVPGDMYPGHWLDIKPN